MGDQNYSSTLSAVHRAFPGLSAANRAKRAAAIHLINDPDRCTSSSVAKAVRDALGASTKELGLAPFRQLLSEDPCFTVHGAQESEAYIVLNLGQLAAAATYRGSLATSNSTMANNSRVAVPLAFTQSKQRPAQRDPSQWKFFQGLLASVDIAFPGDSAASRTKRVTATHLLNYPEHNSMSAVAAAVHDALGASTKALGLPPFKQLLAAEPCFAVDDTQGPEAHIDLNQEQLLKTAGQNIRTAINSIYPATSRASDTRLRCAAALHLTDNPPLYRDKCTRVAAQLLGGTAKCGPSAKSMDRFKQVVLEDPWFKITPSLNPSDVYLKLDAKQLLQLHLQHQTGTPTSAEAVPAATTAAATATTPAHPAAIPALPCPINAAVATPATPAAAASSTPQSPAPASSFSPLSNASSAVPYMSRTGSASSSGSALVPDGLIASTGGGGMSNSSAWSVSHAYVAASVPSWTDVAAVQDVHVPSSPGTVAVVTQPAGVAAPSALDTPFSTSSQSSATPQAVFEAALQAFEAAALAAMPPAASHPVLAAYQHSAIAGGVSGFIRGDAVWESNYVMQAPPQLH